MIKYTSDQDFVYLNGPVKSNVVRDILNAQKTKKGWRLPKNVHALREIYTYIPELRENPILVKDGQSLKQEQEFWKTIKNAPYENGFPELRHYQNQDLGFLMKRGSALVLNEARTGKTPTMISVIKVLKTKRNIIVCPSSLVYNWAKEFKQWYPEIDVYPVNGTPKQRNKVYDLYTTKSKHNKSVLIISKDTWKNDYEKSPIGKHNFDVAVVDEAHFLRNYKTAQSKAIFNLQAKVKFPLTGTPAVKGSQDIFGLLHFINPKAFPSYWNFVERYFNILEDHWGKNIGSVKQRREKELLELMDSISIQRKRKDIMAWLPKAQHQTLPVMMEGKQLKLYEQMLDTFVASEDDLEVDTMNKLSQLMRLRQLCLDPRLLGFEAPSAKTKALLEFAEDNKDPFIVMTTFSSYFKLIKPDLEKLGKKVGIIDGSVSKSERQKVVERFQSGKIDVLLCNIIAAGTGFTLDRADTIVFLDKDFNPANNEQASDRIVPTTKDRLHNINIISLVCGGSIDERVNEILDNKEDLTKLINKPKELVNS